MSTLFLELIGNFVTDALSKFLAAIVTKVASILLVNFFIISIVGYYTICVTTIKIKFSVVRSTFNNGPSVRKKLALLVVGI